MRWLLLFFLSTTVTGTEDPFRQAMQLYAQKNYSDSRKILNVLVESNPTRALYWFNLGNANFMLQDYAAAERSFVKVIELKSPLAPAAWLYRAKSLKESGSTEKAKKILAWLARKHGTPTGLRQEATRELLSDTPDDQSQTALEFYRQGKYRLALRAMKGSPPDNESAQLLKALILIQLDRQDQAQVILKKLTHPLSAVLLESLRTTYSKTKWLYLESNLGYDNNIRKAENAEAGTSLFANAGIGARLWAKDLWLINAGYDGRWNETFGAPDLRVYSHELQSGWGRAAATDLLLLTPFLIHESWDNRPARLGRGVRFHFRTGTTLREYGMSGEWEYDTSLNDDNNYVAGTQTRARIYWGGLFFPVYGQAFLDVERQLTGDQTYSDGTVLPLAYTGWGPSLRLLWKVDRRWALDFDGQYRMRVYRTHIQPGNLLRRDQELNLGLRLTLQAQANLQPYLAMTWTKNSGGAIYQRLQVLTGAVWDIF